MLPPAVQAGILDRSVEHWCWNLVDMFEEDCTDERTCCAPPCMSMCCVPHHRSPRRVRNINKITPREHNEQLVVSPPNDAVKLRTALTYVDQLLRREARAEARQYRLNERQRHRSPCIWSVFTCCDEDDEGSASTTDSDSVMSEDGSPAGSASLV